MNVEKLDAMAKPRSKEAIVKAEERKSSRKISEDYCSYELSRLLEERGFHAPDLHGLDSSQGHLWVKVTHQMAMKWLRNNHKVEICIFPIDDNEKKYQSRILKWFGDCLCSSETFLKNTYEEAVETALKYVLENLI